MSDHPPRTFVIVDPDPAIDILNVLAAVGSVVSVGTFLRGVAAYLRGGRGRRIQNKLDEAVTALRRCFAALQVTYRSILELRASSTQSSQRHIGFDVPGGIRVGRPSVVEAKTLSMLNRRRQQLLDECKQIQQIVLGVQNDLKSYGQIESAPYQFLETLALEINTILGEHEKSLGEIERDVVALLQKADGALADLQKWLVEQQR
jgi:hypothetical protein